MSSELQKQGQVYQLILFQKRQVMSKIPAFISKLSAMLQNEEYQQIISWSQNGDSVQIQDPHKFSDEILPKFFKHKNMASFVRQLNMYSFLRLKDSCHNCYHHPFFHRDRPDLLTKIQRKNSQLKEQESPMDRKEVYNSSSGSESMEYQKQKQYKKLKQENALLQNQKKLLTEKIQEYSSLKERMDKMKIVSETNLNSIEKEEKVKKNTSEDGSAIKNVNPCLSQKSGSNSVRASYKEIP